MDTPRSYLLVVFGHIARGNGEPEPDITVNYVITSMANCIAYCDVLWMDAHSKVLVNIEVI